MFDHPDKFACDFRLAHIQFHKKIYTRIQNYFRLCICKFKTNIHTVKSSEYIIAKKQNKLQKYFRSGYILDNKYQYSVWTLLYLPICILNFLILLSYFSLYK